MVHSMNLTKFSSTERKEAPIAKFGRRDGIKGIYHCQVRSFELFMLRVFHDSFR